MSTMDANFFKSLQALVLMLRPQRVAHIWSGGLLWPVLPGAYPGSGDHKTRGDGRSPLLCDQRSKH